MTPTVKRRNVMEQVSIRCFSCGVDEFIRGDGGDVGVVVILGWWW